MGEKQIGRFCLKHMLLALRLTLCVQVPIAFSVVVTERALSATARDSFDEAVRLYVRGDFESAFSKLEVLEGEGKLDQKTIELKKIVMEEVALQRQGRGVGTTTTQDICEALCQLGQSYAEEGRFADAEELFIAAEKKVGTYLPACLALARLYAKQGDRIKSIQKWEEALSLTGDNGAILFGLGQACVANGELKRAETLFLELMDDKEMGARAGAEAGRILWLRGEKEEAKSVWEGSIARMPMDGYAFFVIAECCQDEGDLGGAKIGYGKALELGYQPQICRRRLSTLSGQ